MDNVAAVAVHVPLCRTAGLKVTVDWLVGETRRYAHGSLSMVGDVCPGRNHAHFLGMRLSTLGHRFIWTFTEFRLYRFADTRLEKTTRPFERLETSASIDELLGHGIDRCYRSKSKMARSVM